MVGLEHYWFAVPAQVRAAGAHEVGHVDPIVPVPVAVPTSRSQGWGTQRRKVPGKTPQRIAVKSEARM